jgi:hypothetical protein
MPAKNSAEIDVITEKNYGLPLKCGKYDGCNRMGCSPAMELRDLEIVKVPLSSCRHTSMVLAGIQKLRWIPANNMPE